MSHSLNWVRVFIFCCLVFLVVWAFRVLFILLFGWGRVFFAVWAGARAPSKQPKKKHASAQTGKCAPSERVFLLLFGRVGRVVFAVWAGGVGEGVLFFGCLGGVRVVFFAVWAGGGGGGLFFSCLGGVRVDLFAVGAGCVLICLLFGRGT